MWDWNNYRYPNEKITTKIKDILESVSFPDKNLSVDEIISNGTTEFFSFEFPWYSDTNEGLSEFKSLFLHKFYMYQIGQETEALFKLNMQSLLMEKMPYWKEVYKTTIMTYDPLINRSLKRTDSYNNNKDSDANNTITVAGNATNNASANSTDTNNTQSISSDNPQVTVQTKDYASGMNRGKTEGTGTVTTEETSTINNTSTNEGKVVNKTTHSGELTEEGFIGDSQSENIIKYRKAIVNLNLEICDYLKRLFLMVY